MWCLRKMTKADIDAVLAIEADCFQHPWDRAAFLDELASRDAASIILNRSSAPEPDKISAYMSFRLLYDEMHLMKIAVAPEWRGAGLASLMLGQGLKEAAAGGAVAAILEVGLTNKPALGLYQRFGFRRIGRRKQYYSKTGEDALVLMRPI